MPFPRTCRRATLPSVLAETVTMRKVRDYDAELRALGDRTKAVKAKRVEQLGQLVAATGADTLDAETLAGVLLDAVGSRDANVKEAWRAKGAAFFQRPGRKTGGDAGGNATSAQAEPDGDASGGSVANSLV